MSAEDEMVDAISESIKLTIDQIGLDLIDKAAEKDKELETIVWPENEKISEWGL